MENPASYFTDGESFSFDKLSPMKFEPRAKPKPTPAAATTPRKEVVVPRKPAQTTIKPVQVIRKPNPNWAKQASPAMKEFARGATGG